MSGANMRPDFARPMRFGRNVSEPSHARFVRGCNDLQCSGTPTLGGCYGEVECVLLKDRFFETSHTAETMYEYIMRSRERDGSRLMS
jgi:hypothetical protein